MSKLNGKFNYRDGVSLKEYFDLKIEGIEKATGLARDAMEKRLEGMNEFRETLRDQASRFITRDDLVSKLDVIDARIKILELSKANLEGKASLSSVYIAYGISFVGLVLSLLGLIWGNLK